ncbi:phage baseplate assembly protein V [Niabella aurantiaca]|uniref:phage baseplate assembly protein V n=1 Tax=Niabella aurantiaca TaxID=379900 RepID=UPI003CCC32CE
MRVKFHWMNGSEKTPWIRVTSPHGGGGKGHFFIPEIGEEVIVGFESDSATKPYVIGTVYHGSANNRFSNAANDLKVIRTRSGHTVEFNDAGEGTHIIIRDPGGNEIYLDTTGKNITITAPETMTFNATNMRMNVKEDMKVNVGKDLVTTIGRDKQENIGKRSIKKSENSEELVLENRKVRVGRRMETIGSEVLLHSSNGKMLIDATDKLTLQSKNRINYGE